MRLRRHSFAGLVCVAVVSAAFTTPALAGESTSQSAPSSTQIAQATDQSPAVQEAVNRVREVYSKICSKNTRAAVPAPRPMVPQPMPVSPMPATPMPQMW